MTWGCRWLPSDCYTSKATFARKSIPTASSTRSIRTTTRANCRSLRFARPNGEWLRIPISTPGFKMWLRCWKVEVGRSNLYLLDSNDLANPAAFRGVTSELYGGDSELRLRQELILGLAGWRLLRALGLRPEICHLNEGHAAFAILERARSYMTDNGVSFDVALAATRAGNLFTTHTAVEAGFDRFAPDLCAKYLTVLADELGISLEKLLALGRQDPNNASEPFNMAYLALRGSGAVNGVSRLHGEVSRRLFGSLFPRWPEKDVPVGYVTNGIHVGTWESPASDALWARACGSDRTALASPRKSPRTCGRFPMPICGNCEPADRED